MYSDKMAEQPIIIKRKKAAHGSHGGAWKVAYADFVTAMMALFIVLWLLSSDEQTKKAVGGYFIDPSGKGRETGSGLSGSGESLSVGRTDLAKLKEKLQSAVKSVPDLKMIKDQVQITVTGEGLRVELFETEKGTFFESGSARPNPSCVTLISLLAQEIGKLSNAIAIEGHTDSKPFPGENGYNNWDLSTDRANTARRIMQSSGVRPEQLMQIRGYADRFLLRKEDPFNAANRRVSIIVQYQAAPTGGDLAPKQAEISSKTRATG